MSTLGYEMNISDLEKGKGKVRPRTGHEGPEGSTGIVLLFL